MALAVVIKCRCGIVVRRHTRNPEGVTTVAVGSCIKLSECLPSGEDTRYQCSHL